MRLQEVGCGPGSGRPRHADIQPLGSKKTGNRQDRGAFPGAHIRTFIRIYRKDDLMNKPPLWSTGGLAGLSVAALSACGSLSEAMQPSPVESAVMSYYEDHASEQNGRCLNPYMDALTGVDVVEESKSRIVVDARYFYRDRFMDGGEGLGVECSGSGERRFTLARDQAGLQVVEMSGPGAS